MGKNIKLPLKDGFATLCSHIKAIKRTAEQSGSAVTSLAQATAASLEEIEGILNEKQDVKDAEEKVNAIVRAILSGGVSMPITSREGVVLCTRGGDEIYALKTL